MSQLIRALLRIAAVLLFTFASLQVQAGLEIKIEGKNNKTSNIISWNTSSELSGCWYYVETSTDGQEFETIGIIKGKGDQQANNSYSFEHNNVQHNISYYRVRETYPGGAYKYSLTISLELKGIEEALYPNPAINYLMLAGFSGLKFDICDKSGKTIFSGFCESANYQIDISFLSGGSYFIRFENSNSSTTIWFFKT